MLGITEKHNQFKKSTYFAGGKFVIYAACVYLAATFAAGCLGAVIGFPLLTFPLAMLISNPVVWVLMGVVLTAAYKMVVKPLFHLAKDYINKKKAPEGEKSEEKEVEPQKSPEKQEQTVANQERPKTPGRDSGIFECEKDKNSFLYKTENGDYKYHLSTTDIIDIAKSKYRWIGYIDRKGLKDTSQGVYFTCPDNLESSLHGQLKKYKSQQEGKNLIFTSILNLNGNHWVTLVVAYNPNSVSRAYYCDSFGKDLPNEILDALQKTLKMGRNNIRISKEKQQEDNYNCGIFALENAHRITQMFNENKSSDEIKRELSEYKPNEEELKNKRIEFAKVLEKYKRSGVNMPDSQRKSRRSSVASGDSGVDVNSAKDKRYKVVKYSTSGERNNCFFHSVFGEKDSVGTYQTKKAQEMRMEWHEFLSQFNSLDDERMPPALRAELRTVFNMFLDRPRDLTDKYKEIEKLAEHTKKKIKKVEKKVRKLIKKLLSRGLPENEVSSNLRELAVNNLISTKRYDKNYSSESVTNSFLNGKSIYKSYLEAIKSPYQVFTEEIPILASLANIEIHLHPHISHNQGTFKPNPEMINEGYQRNNELWGNKKQETIYLTPGHYERAGIVEVETSFIEKVSSFMQGVTTAVCNIVKNAFSSN